MKNFPLDKTLAVILAYPNNMVTIELLTWLQQIGVGKQISVCPVHRFYGERCTLVKEICIGMNVQVKTALEHRDWDFFLFAENDIRPDLALTAPFLEAEGDVVCAEYETECMHDHAWGPADAFHTGLWRTSRRVLEVMEPPYFLPQYNSDATAVVGCHCNHLRRKLTEKGFRICHTGRVDHSPQHPSVLAAEQKPLPVPEVRP